MDITRVIVVGAGGHAQVVVDILLCLQRRGDPISPIGYLDDDPSKQGKMILGLPVLGFVNDVGSWPHDALLVAIGNNKSRSHVYRNLLRDGEQYASAWHPTAIIGADVVIGQGTMICAGTIINPGARIGNNVILNTGCRIDHHCSIGDNAHIAPGATLGGEVEIGEGVLVGLGASVLPRKHLGDWSIVGAGALVHRHVAPNDTVAGVPATSI